MKEFKEGPTPPRFGQQPVAKKPATPLPAPAGKKSSVVMRSMHDDLQRTAPSSVPPPTPHTKPTLAGAPAQEPVGTKPAVPLPPKKPGKRKKAARPRRRQAKSRRAVVAFLLGGIVLVLLAGGAWWLLTSFLFTGGTNSATPAADEPPAIAAAMLPAGAEAIVGYVVQSEEDRTAILGAWEDGRPASVDALLAGDPRLLVARNEVTELYYVLLPDDPRPYLIVPALETVQELLTENSDARSETLNGWLVLHSLGTENYATALAERSVLDEVGSTTALTTTVAGAPFRLHLASDVLQQLRGSTLGSSATRGSLQSVTVAGRFRPGGIELAGTGAVVSAPLTTSQTNQQLLTLVPNNATFARFGASLAVEVAEWQQTSSALATGALQPPTVQQLLAELPAPYAFYTTTTDDFGLVVELPAALQGVLQNGDAAIEQALAGLVPLVVGSETATPITFNDGEYGGLTLRYANLNGSGAALDYAVTGTHLLVATSKDAMFSLIDTVNATAASLADAPLATSLTATWGALPATPVLTLGEFSLPDLQALLPQGAHQQTLSVGLASTPGTTTVNSVTIQGVITTGAPAEETL